MSDSIVQAKASFQRWLTAFNTRDVEGMIADMHFPHRRLSGENKFQVWETADDFRANNEISIAARNTQGWGFNVANSIDAVQSGADKVHLAINYARCRANGTEY